MRGILRVALTIGAMMFGGLAFASPIVIKYSHVNAENTPKGYGAIKFKELAEARLPGKVEVQVFPNGQLFGDEKEMEALMLGDVHILAPSASKLHKYTSRLQVFDLPFLFDSIEAVDRFEASSEGSALLSELDSKGFIGLGFLRNGMKQLSARRKVILPEDARGLNFRVQTSDVLEAQFKAVGAIPQKLAFSEVYQALQTGVVDGQENSWTSIYTSKFYEVQPYITESNHGVMEFIVISNADWWNGLPDEIRDGLRAAMTEANAEANAFSSKMHEENKQKIADSGQSEINVLTPEQVAKWREVMHPVYAQFADEIGPDLVAAARRANRPAAN